MKRVFLLLFATCAFQIFAQPTFQKHFEMSQFVALNSYTLPDGILFKGLGQNGLDEGFCKVSENGTVSWQQFFVNGSKITKSLMAPINDLDYTHVFPLYHAFSVYKTSNHQMMWENNYLEHPDVIIEDFPMGVCCVKNLTNGKICVAGKSSAIIYLPDDTIAVECPVIILFDETGNLLWSKMYQIGNDNFTPADFIENSNGDLIVIGRYWAGIPGNITPLGFGTLEISRNDGVISGTGGANTFVSNDADFVVGPSDNIAKTFLVTSQNLNGSFPNYRSSFLINLNDDGTFGQAKRFDANDTLCSAILSFAKTSANETYLSGNYETYFPESGTSFTNTFCLKTDATGSNIFWAKRYGPEPTVVGGQALTVFYNFLISETDNSLLFSGSNEISSGYLWKASRATGDAACESVDVAINISDFNFTNTLVGTAIRFEDYLVNRTTPVLVNDTQIASSALLLTEICSVNGIVEGDIHEGTFQIYPNPVNQPFITIHFENPEIYSLVLSDIFGRKTKKILVKSQTQTIEILPEMQGFYFATAFDKWGNRLEVKKLLVE
jgi:hypothetical protein